MKKIFALLMGLLFLTRGAVAEDTFPATVVGVVDLMKIQAASTLYKGIAEEVKKYGEKHKPALDDKAKEFRDESQKILKQQGSISQNEYDEKVLNFRKKVDAFETEIKKENSEFNGRVQATLAEAGAKALAPTISEVAGKHGVTLVINRSQVIFFNEAIDMTDEVITLLNKKFPKMELKKAAKKAPAKKAQKKK